MDLEKLNKSQIVLLTLLVSFVTSIATGIVSVTLMEQAPPAITQTVNRIVERTIEKVVPGQVAAAAAPVTEKTVITQPQDSISTAVQKASPSAVRLFGKGTDDAGNPIELFLGLGVVATNDGLIFADASMMSDSAIVSVQLGDGTRVPASVIGRDKDAGIVRLQGATSTTLTVGTTTQTKIISWAPATFLKSTSTLGETVVVLAGKTGLKIASGIVTAVPDAGSSFIETSVPQDSFVVGSPLITMNGEVLGIATAASRAGANGGFLASPIVLSYNKPSDKDKAVASQ